MWHHCQTQQCPQLLPLQEMLLLLSSELGIPGESKIPAPLEENIAHAVSHTELLLAGNSSKSSWECAQNITGMWESTQGLSFHLSLPSTASPAGQPG